MHAHNYVLKKEDTDTAVFHFVDSKLVLDKVLADQDMPIFIQLRGVSSDNIHEWLNNRKIPLNREYSEGLLSNFMVDIDELEDVLGISYGLSLNDPYWVVPEGFAGAYSQYNLYDNPFSEVVEELAFTGDYYGNCSSFVSTPELTTGGMMRKAWHRDNNIKLYKGCTMGYANAGKEPQSEYFAAQLAKFMGFEHVPYNIEMYKHTVCSVCPLFTSKEVSYIPMAQLIPEGSRMKGISDYLLSYGSRENNPFIESLADMLIFDALILNTDRHLNNFGMLYDNAENCPISFAPLFDHGFSLLNHALDSELDSYLEGKIETPQPVVYEDFIKTAASFASEKHYRLLKKLEVFEFTQHPEYPLEERRFSVLNKYVQKRAHQLMQAIEAKH